MRFTLVSLAAIMIASVPVFGAAPKQDGAHKIGGKFDPPPPGKGQVIFFRVGRHSDDPWSSCTVREGDDPKRAPILSKLGQNRYFVVQVDPGVHHYLSKTEATDRLTLEIEAGETYFVECTMGWGILVQHPDLKPANEADFMAHSSRLARMPVRRP